MKSDHAIDELAGMATRCLSGSEFRAEALAWVDRTIGVDGANLAQIDGPRVSIAATLRLDDPWIDRFHARIFGYRSDLRSLMNATLEMGGATFGEASRLEKWAALPGREGFEEEMAFPLGFRIGSVVAVTLRGAERAVLFLGRGGRKRIFTADEAAMMTRAAPILALGMAIHEPRRADGARQTVALRRALAPRRALTPRERTVIEYATLGLSNREIGLALDVSPHTIRNQLAAIFEKLGVGSRAELVAVALIEGLVEMGPTSPSR